MYDRESLAAQVAARGPVDEPAVDEKGEAARGQAQELNGYTQNHAAAAMPMFVNEAEDPAVVDAADGSGHKEIRYQRNVEANPTLSFADDGSMAVQASGHAKEMFATDAVLNDAEAALAGHESKVALIKTGNSIGLDGGVLHQVKPGLRSKGLDQAAEQVTNLTVDICVGLASKIEGGSETSQTRVERTDDDAKYSELQVGSAASDDIDRLAIELSEEAKGRKLAKDADLPADLGKTYGRLAQDPQFQAAAKAHGVNEFARPKVGEMLGIFSVFREAKKADADPTAPILEQMEKRRDFTAAGPSKQREFSWGYHYAGVVASSRDQADYVTLENYNRSSDIEEATKTAVDQLVAAKGGAIKQWWARKKLAGHTPREQLELMVKDKIGDNDQAVKAQLSRTLDAKNGEAWYFAMYGSKAGQSFHEKNAASGYFANPLTVVSSSEDARAIKASRTYQKHGTTPIAVGGDAVAERARIWTEWKDAIKPTALATPTVAAMDELNRGFQAQLMAVLAPDYWSAVLTAVAEPEVSQALANVTVTNALELSSALNRLYETLGMRDDTEALTLLARPRIDACTKLLKWFTG